MTDYRGRVVLVTGGTQGIGEGCVRAFAGAGATVVFCARRAEPGRALERELGPSVAFLPCDVSKVAEVQAVVDAAAARHGRLDCLVNNAGWHPPHRPIDQFSEEDFRELLELNVVSMFAACRRALPHLRKTKGCIVNLSSLVARMGQHHATTYVATKGAVTAFTKALAVDEAVHGVRVNCISPGNVWTPLWEQAVRGAPDPAACKAKGEAAQLLGRMGTIEEAGRLCLFLAAEATFTTGADLVLSGGAELGYGRKSRTSPDGPRP
jgi:NAD(P)-dependent dehydrogenase (short-subunit alcohol dehydrogenase family)